MDEIDTVDRSTSQMRYKYFSGRSRIKLISRFGYNDKV